MSNERVLVVDDEQLNLFIIEEFLEGEALQLDVQSDPLAAWDNLQSADPPFSLVSCRQFRRR